VSQNTQILCPVCGCESITETKNYSGGLHFAAVRFYHDRRCQRCEAIWTPPTPRWAAWACIFCGTMFIAGFMLATYYFISPHITDKLFDGEKRTKMALTDTIAKVVAPLFMLLATPGTGFIFHGIRSLATTQEPKITKTSSK